MDAHALALSCMGAPASVSIRINPFKQIPAPSDGVRVPWNEYGYVLQSRPQFTLDPLFHAGCYYVQDSSAMFVGHLFRRLAKGSGLKVLDLCAAPGGKTTDLAASLRLACGDDFLLVANEVMRQRASVLCDNVAIWGDPNVVVTSVDPAAFARLGSFFDIILADVPCSGEGMFRKDPRAVEEWSPELVKLCAARQKRILADAWPALKKGGILLYSTCTFEEEENDCNLEWAASELGGTIIPVTDAPAGVRLTRSGYMLVPGEVSGEGQWAGALIKDSDGGSLRGSLSDLRPLKQGVKKGIQKGKDFVPDADYALSLDFCRDDYPLVELDLDTALKFLHRDCFAIKDAPTGYLAVCYQGHPLGFVKNLGNRCNNLLPAGRRIRMNI